ncbi:chemotaxis-specific protein-glutamate methyltransferase CheB [Acanthopleuribacter pedis]|uniref:Protein-glutamate methylesterase/protein-glutamine glutaminase n=1 Tax=Acanthopleuribacter pedis TaxID=442870 RepID=A0A8J7QQD5_9BACT|nr:chemotaxis-specific protein-glutamate methyltransferase CheB [Acanthopleuribacter pedis]MBO1322240.1 chemotaxis-specific protein-glutamate methyltransferase CheB [Acanthopleuribacter pedis]
MTRVLIVEDMATYRTIIARSLAEIDDTKVVGRVSNGKKALDFLEKNEVDLITLDVEMPIMDGLATLKELRKRRLHIDVVMLSGLTDQAASLTIKCLELGAVDFVLKPATNSFAENQKLLVDSLSAIIANLRRRAAFRSRFKSNQRTKTSAPPASGTPSRRTSLLKDKPAGSTSSAPAAPAPSQEAKPATGFRRRLSLPRPKLLLIGVSTGGPKALSEVFDHLRGPLPFPILIVQHMPPKFTKSLADSLNRKTDIEVSEAMDGDLVKPNCAYIAPGGYHMVLMKDEDFGYILATNQTPPVNSCRPSVDVLFDSVQPFFNQGEIAALIMTGMGRDGADSCERLHKKRHYIMSQSAETCTIYGMPKAVEDLGLPDQVLDLEDIAPTIMKLGKQAAMFPGKNIWGE